MRRLLLVPLLLTACVSVSSARTVRTFSQEFETADLRGVQLDVPVGDIEIHGVDEERISVEVRIQCDRGDSHCREDAEYVELVARERRNELRLDFDGLSDHDGSDMSIDVELRLPAALALEVDLGVGELHVGELASHVRADVGVGQVRVRMREELVGSVDLEVGIGEARLRPDPRRRSRSRSRMINLGDDVSGVT
jgi:hypothetical protein